MNKKLITLLMAGMVLIAWAGLATADTITYVGSSTVGKFIQDAEKVYTAADFKINTKPESGGGENATVAGHADIGGVAREVKPQIMAKGIVKTLIGKDAIGAWVHQDNPVQDLSTTQLAGIFSGTITNWNEVGGTDAPIAVYVVNPQSATRKVFGKVILNGSEYGGNLQTVRPDPNIVDKVAADPNGIGQLSFSLGANHPQASAVRKVSVDGQAPDVTNSDYPITRPLYLITKGAPAGAARGFIAWSLSAEGQAVVMQNFVGAGTAAPTP